MKNLEKTEEPKGWNSKHFCFTRNPERRFVDMIEDDVVIDNAVNLEERMEYLEKRKEFVKVMLDRWKKNRGKK